MRIKQGFTTGLTRAATNGQEPTTVYRSTTDKGRLFPMSFSLRFTPNGQEWPEVHGSTAVPNSVQRAAVGGPGRLSRVVCGNVPNWQECAAVVQCTAGVQFDGVRQV